MQQKLENHIQQNFPFLNGKKLLLAISGGIDSMVMLDLFRKLSFEIAIAHCNFQLRGVESTEDQNFIQNYADANEINIFLTQFDTETFAKENKFSTQVAARELRYHWFQEIVKTENFDFILTAHHADDTLETFFINLIRGTGLDGLTGIPPQNENIIRPLLIFSRQEIKQYANENKINWREDSSNASDKYLRNKIRHHLIPVLKDLNTDFLSSFLKTQLYLQDAQTMLKDASIGAYQKLTKEKGGGVQFDLKELIKLPNYKSYLYHWLRDYGFTAWEDIYDLVGGQTGKQVYSKDFRLLKNRDTLILMSKNKAEKTDEFLIDDNYDSVNLPINLSFSKVADIAICSNTTIFVDEDKLHFPLVLRRWEEGDYLNPFGMQGKSKKLSKLFKDEKLSLIDKQNTWLLCSDAKIVWVVGIRQDERFKIENQTKNILKIQIE